MAQKGEVATINAEELQRYCICKRPYEEQEFMIECSACSDWFHGRFVIEHSRNYRLGKQYHDGCTL